MILTKRGQKKVTPQISLLYTRYFIILRIERKYCFHSNKSYKSNVKVEIKVKINLITKIKQNFEKKTNQVNST